MELPIQRRRTPSSWSSKSTCFLPIDLTLEILAKLPAKSIVRFRCVSKLWSSITTTPYFINSFYTRSTTKPSLLLCFKQDEKLCVLSVPQDYQSVNESSDPIDRYHMEFPIERGHFYATESVHGLICFHASTLIVCNPSIRKLFTIPKPEKRWSSIAIGMILGYDPVEGKHKVVCFPPNRAQGEGQVLTVGSSIQTWRTVKTNHKHYACIHARCINGVVYYKAFAQAHVLIVMSFNVRSEKFDMIKLPQECEAYEYEVRNILMNYEGKLASVVNNNSDGGIKLCILEDAEKHEWSYKSFSALKAHPDQSLKTNFKLRGITDAGEFIYVPSELLESFYILYFDPKKKSFRKVEIEGSEHENFLLRNGLGNLSMSRRRFTYWLDEIPNHMESLLSF